MEKRELLLRDLSGKVIGHGELEDSDVEKIARALAGKEGNKLLRITEVEARVGLKKSAIYARIKEGTFPAPVKPHGVSSSRWRESDVDEWIAKAASAIP